MTRCSDFLTFKVLSILILCVGLFACSSYENIQVVKMKDYQMLYHDFSNIDDSIKLKGLEKMTIRDSIVKNYSFNDTDRILDAEISVNCKEIVDSYGNLPKSKQRKLRKQAANYNCKTILIYNQNYEGIFLAGCDTITIEELDSLKNTLK